MGKWVPIHSEEYDGEVPIETGREHQDKNGDTGEVIFRGDQLPWSAGEYELRYHHDGKHNVMSSLGQVEIFGERFGEVMGSNSAKPCVSEQAC